MKTVRVAAAIICDNPAKPTRIFAAARGYGEYRGDWEFPGGKLEPGESAEQALVREIREELDVTVEVGRLLKTVEYDYPAFHLSMDCFLCRITDGEIFLREAQSGKWLTAGELLSVRWLPADETILDALQAALG